MKGSFHQSRRQSNFYNSMNKKEQLDYARQWVATCNSKALEPFVKITGASKYNREVFYEINIDRLLNVEKENKRYRATINAMGQILKDAIHSLDVGEKVQGLEYGVAMRDKALEGEE